MRFSPASALLTLALLFAAAPADAGQQVTSFDGNPVPAFREPESYCKYLNIVGANGGIAPASGKGGDVQWVNVASRSPVVPLPGTTKTAVCFGRTLRFAAVSIPGQTGVWYVLIANLHS